MRRILAGTWRDDARGPMQVVSGPVGRERVHVEAPAAALLPDEMARFWERAAGLSINDRQRLVLNRLIDGFEGKLTTQKWATLAKCSHDTALRDIRGLIEHGLLNKDEGGGRSTSYSLPGERDLASDSLRR